MIEVEPQQRYLGVMPAVLPGAISAKDGTGAASVEVELVLSQEADADYGEYLAGECLTCHQKSGATDGVPPITGLDSVHFIQALLDYKNGVRTNSVMKLMATGLGNEEIASLALYFSGLK